MRAVVFDGRELRVDAQRAEPVLGPGEALIRPLLAGVCATDLEICRGYLGFKGVVGHEFVGVVEKVHEETGDEGRRFVGQRVVGTINCICAACDMCTGGLPAHCRNRTVLGIAGRDGCFADRFTLPVRNLMVVPEGVDNDRAVFTEPLAAACQVLRQVSLNERGYVTVLGDGRLGLLTAQALARHNRSVRVLGKHTEKLARCERWGIKHRLVSDISPRADQEVVVDCTGAAEGLRMAMRLVRPGGKIVLKTTVQDQTGVDLSPLVIHEIQLIGSRCGPFPEALSLLQNGQVDVLSLISRRMKLSDGVAALRVASQPDVVKVLLEFD